MSIKQGEQPRARFRQCLAVEPQRFGVGHRVLQPQPDKGAPEPSRRAHERKPVAQLIFHLVVRQLVKRLASTRPLKICTSTQGWGERAKRAAASDPLELAPGVRRLRPDDHFMVLAETDASPMHVGALLLIEVPAAEMSGLLERLRRHYAERLPGTPLLACLVTAPEGYDSDVWAELAAADMTAHIVRETAPTPNLSALHAAVASLNLQRLDLAWPPFMAHLFDGLPGDRAAIYFRMHHAVADGIGFQEVLRRLSDEVPPVEPRAGDAQLPDPATWHALAEAKFAAEKGVRSEQSAASRTALAALQAFKSERAEAPGLTLSGLTSARRSYTTLSMPLEEFKQTAKALGATICFLLALRRRCAVT